MRLRPRLASALSLCALAALSSCGEKLPLQPVNRSPVVQSLIAFPTSVSPGDSVIIVCHATDPDGDTLSFDWVSDCRLTDRYGHIEVYNTGSAMVFHAGSCARAPVDTGSVECEVRDGKGGGARAGVVHIVIHS